MAKRIPKSNKASFESYFIYENDKNDKNYTFQEYTVYNIYHGIFTATYTTNDKKIFIDAYFDYIRKNLKSSRTKLSEYPPTSKKTHQLSLLLVESCKKFGWVEFDPSNDVKTIAANQSIQSSSNENKLFSAIGDYISKGTEEELLIDDPLYSGIIDTENIETQKPRLLQTIQKLDEWNKRIWDNKYYQEQSVLINKATFTHDILSSLLNFISPGHFKRWDQAQKVSYGPFHPDPELLISEDNIKLGKLGKDSIDRIGKLLNTDEIPIILIYFFQDEISFYLMDKEFFTCI
ncbi:hypothetical protein C2G38_2156494 [Gigaspora rosea]|uniref:Uncharacterized protein n=1 Tax=Gigaspora rosea TaxID=44941 RepID=A0A397W2M5_9GLOM|nr:hypothetical protein C2G38_2156494 [Gigaspora rosea]